MSVPTINVNLKPCSCGHWQWLAGDVGPTKCVCAPVLIPCPIPRAVTFEVAPGECDCAEDARRRRGMPLEPHLRSCHARPIRVVCYIDGETWGDSHVEDIEYPDGEPQKGTESALVPMAWERWRAIQMLALGHPATADAVGVLSEAIPALESQRDAVFSALCDMARAESAIIQRFVDVDKVYTNRMRKAFSGVVADELSAYVEHLIEQVGVLP